MPNHFVISNERERGEILVSALDEISHSVRDDTSLSFRNEAERSEKSHLMYIR